MVGLGERDLLKSGFGGLFNSELETGMFKPLPPLSLSYTQKKENEKINKMLARKLRHDFQFSLALCYHYFLFLIYSWYCETVMLLMALFLQLPKSWH